MFKKRAAGAVAALGLAMATTLAMAAPADAATAGMTCSKLGYYATGNVNYTNSGSQHHISTYDWVIHGQANSTQNDVSVTLYHDRTGIPDETLNGFASGRERNGYGVHGVNLSYPTSYTLHGTFLFVFDINNIEPDPRCSGETTRF
jgi:hypothetical protein